MKTRIYATPAVKPLGAKHDYGMFNSRVKPYAADYYVHMMLVWC